MKLDDIPDLKGNQYPARISISITSETKHKLDALKKSGRKDTASLVRMLINEFLKDIEFDFEDAV